MPIYDYKDYSATEAADLVALSLKLASYTSLPKVFGIESATVIEAMFDAFGDGGLTGQAVTTGLPPGWREMTVQELGLPAELLDSMGQIKIESPITGWAESGPQVKILAETDAAGRITGLCVSYAGTNSPVDFPDYLQLPTGEIAAMLSPILEAVRTVAEANGLTGEDVMITGYSLGAGMANIQARYADTLAGGFFADSDYISHEAPVIYDDPSRILNVGWENDVVFRVVGTQPTVEEAAAAGGPLLVPPDYDLTTTTDNLVSFDGAYASALWPFGPFSLLNIVGGWWAHVAGGLSTGHERIAHSAFYDLTTQDSVVVVSNLGADMRDTTWVWDKPAPNHDDRPFATTFVVGTEWGDRLKDGKGGDYLDGGAGDDILRAVQGANRVEGGAGTDTLRLSGYHGDWTVYRMADGTLFFAGKGALTEATGVERVDFEGLGDENGLINWPYSVQSDRLEDEHWSLFDWGDNDVTYARAVEGTAGADVLAGKAVFGRAGADQISGTSGADLLHGGTGDDRLTLGSNGDRGYGAEGNDVLTATTGGVRMNGGMGADTFVFAAGLKGEIVVEDFDAMGAGDDVLMLSGSQFANPGARLVQDGCDVLIRGDGVTIRLVGTDLAHVGADDLLVA